MSELSLPPPPLLPSLLLCIRRKAIVSYERGRSLSGRETFGNLGRRTHSAGFPSKDSPFRKLFVFYIWEILPLSTDSQRENYVVGTLFLSLSCGPTSAAVLGKKTTM